MRNHIHTFQNHVESVDLSDEQGSVKNLRINPTDYGTEYFGERETVILLKVESENFFIY